MERPLACGCTTGECDGLTCGFVVTTTAHDHNMTDHHTVEQDSGVCVETQVAPKAHHPYKSSGPGHGVYQTVNTQATLNRLPMIRNTMILNRLENRT